MHQPEAFRPCVLIPHFNHARQIRAVLGQLAATGLVTIIVDDGSNPDNLAMLRAAVAGLPWVHLHAEPENRGKGAAVATGLRIAGSMGFSHAVQLDADGQHRIADIPVLLAEAAAQPAALVSGAPVYDSTVPPARLHGRQISLFWTRLETWSRDIQDAMCGFRVYPVAASNALLSGARTGRGMEFDAEVLVRAHWAGMPLRFTPTAVTYPPDGLSHFRMVRDNVRISAMHTRLFFGMLWRIPLLIRRRLERAPAR